MSFQPIGYDSNVNLSNQKYNQNFSQTNRPQTPVFLMQMSGTDQYKQNLEQNLTGYLTSNETKSEISDLSGSILPKDVNYYYNERERVISKVQAIFLIEKNTTDKMLDKFLEQIIAIFETKRKD